MGQGQSSEGQPSKEEVTAELAEKFARKCFDGIELHHFKDNFKSLADHEHTMRYLKQDTIARFLELPDILGVSPVVFQLVSYIGAFPFLSDAPAVLGFEQMIIVVAIMTSRYTKILAKGAATRRKLLFRSLAVYDRKLSEVEKEATSPKGDKGFQSGGIQAHSPGFAIDEAGDDIDEGDAEDDELVLAALNSLDLNDSFKAGDLHSASTHGAMIPADNFRTLIMLLLLVAPLDSQESLSTSADRVQGEELERLRSCAETVLSTFLNVEKSPGITSSRFNSVIPTNFPHMFTGFNPLFEHFLFSKNIDLSKRKDGTTIAAPTTIPRPPLLQDKARILNLSVLSQLSFFIPGEELFRRLRLLYSGAEAGFSLGSYETKVFNWRAPTILLVSGTRISGKMGTAHGAEAIFNESLPPKRFPDGSPPEQDKLVFGVFIRQPWRHTSKECFGDSDTILFQLSPTHDVFPASVINKDYVAFAKPSTTAYPGIMVGCPHPKSSRNTNVVRTLGPVSLVIDASFEFGVFNHDYTSRGGAFAGSVSRKHDFQERFRIDDIEVWGCGGDEEAKIQRERWEWEAREAEARRKVNLGTGDVDADRALLEMAGLVGANRSGGSMA